MPACASRGPGWQLAPTSGIYRASPIHSHLHVPNVDNTSNHYARHVPRTLTHRQRQPRGSEQGSQHTTISACAASTGKVGASCKSTNSSRRNVACQASRASMSDSLEEVRARRSTAMTAYSETKHFKPVCSSSNDIKCRWDCKKGSAVSSAFLLISLKPRPSCKQHSLLLHCSLWCSTFGAHTALHPCGQSATTWIYSYALCLLWTTSPDSWCVPLDAVQIPACTNTHSCRVSNPSHTICVWLHADQKLP